MDYNSAANIDAYMVDPAVSVVIEADYVSRLDILYGYFLAHLRL